VQGFNSNRRNSPDSYVIQWDPTLKAAKPAVAHKAGKITVLALSPSGEILASGSSEGEVSVHLTRGMIKVGRMRHAHAVFVTTLAFSPDSKKLLSTSGDTSAHVMAVSAQPPALQVRSRLTPSGLRFHR
jgi:WD40 repeat protein